MRVDLLGTFNRKFKAPKILGNGKDVKVTAYMAIVRPKLEYACAACGPHF